MNAMDPGKVIVVNFKGQEFRFLIKTFPLAALDELWIESHKGAYLNYVGGDVGDFDAQRKARTLAMAELVIQSGLPQAQNETLAVGMLPAQVINAVIQEYNNQFKDVAEEAKKS